MPDTRTDQHDCAHPACGCKVAAGNKVLQRLLQEGARDGTPLQLHAPWMSRVTYPGLTRRERRDREDQSRREVAAESRSSLVAPEVASASGAPRRMEIELHS